MSTVSHMQYTDLDVWKKARALVNWIYTLTKTFPKEEAFGLTSQMRRCAISIPSNLAEGCGRNTAKEAIQFYYIARGSLYELATQLYLACDQGYIDQQKLQTSLNTVIDCKKLINGYISYTRTLPPRPKNNTKQRAD